MRKERRVFFVFFKSLEGRRVDGGEGG